MTEPVITIQHVTKEFTIAGKGKGIKGIFFRPKKTFRALDTISFHVNQGDIVGYIGPNGSGKSTTIKLLTGILVPTSGKVNVLGFIPWEERNQYTYNIGVVFGHKSLLWWDIPPFECFRLYKEIYEMDEKTYQKRLDYLIPLFAIEEFMNTPTRKLSLGERMRCELVAALIHTPKILFLDEPTIGLDVVAKQRMREAIREINEKEKTTVVLTTHDMRDIEELANRILILNEGKIIYEGNLEDVRERFIHTNTIEFELIKANHPAKFAHLVSKHAILQEGKTFTLTFNRKEHSTKKVLDELFDCCDIAHFEVHEPTLEQIVRDIYDQNTHQKR